MKHHFPNLNAIRCFAAFAVVIHHTEQVKSWLGLKNYWDKPFVEALGPIGVLCFFVLSGFLITYLLLEEKENKGTIAIKHFYIRRILRIWPLYYLIFFLGFFVYPHIHFLDLPPWVNYTFVDFKLKAFLFAFFLPNVVVLFFPGGYFASIAWSVGVEEQFYLMWPHVVKRIKNIPLFFLMFITVYIIINVGLTALNKHSNLGLDKLIIFYRHLSIDCMAIGGIFAYLYFTKHKFLNFFYKKSIQLICVLLLVVLIAFNVDLHFIQNEFYGLLFGIIILNLATNKNCIINLETKVLNYFGKISYGLYMYHFVIVACVIKLLAALHIDSILLQYVLIIPTVIGVASLSFYYFEGKFLKLKRNFE